MFQRDYVNILKQIGSSEDLALLAKKLNLSEEFLLVLYTQKVLRDVKRRYYVIKRRLGEIKREWESGKSICALSKMYGDFPPLLLAFMLFTANGISRKQFWAWVRNLEDVEDERIRREIEEASQADLVYSPRAIEMQQMRGKRGEEKLYRALDERKVEYMREYEISGKFRKTPDALLITPLRLGNFEVNWIESKANFGDILEVRANAKRQFAHYVKLFGTGVAVYWFGLVEDVEHPNGVCLFDEFGFYNFLSKARTLPKRNLKFCGNVA